jgi:hypothetical protein
MRRATTLHESRGIGKRFGARPWMLELSSVGSGFFAALHPSGVPPAQNDRGAALRRG